MKIVFVMDQSDDSSNGTTVTVRRMAENLRKNGHTVTLLAGGKPEEGKICAKKHKIPFFQWLIEAQGMCFAKPDPALYYKAFKDADIVHFFMPFRFCREGEKNARQMRIPTVGGFHIQPQNITSSLFLGKSKAANEYLYRWFYKVFYNRFTHIHCPSNFIARQLEEHNYQAEIRVVSNGVSREFQKMDAERPVEWEGKFVILMIGRFSREKRQDLLIKAVAKSRYADKIQLVFAGKGPCHRQYRRMGKRLANRPLMSFYKQDELIRLINSCDLYAHTSDAEIEGISCLEAMACGLVPVISDSELSATGQYALHPQCLFAAGDAHSLAQRIDYWIEHPEEKDGLSIQYIRQQDENRVDICAKKMETLYQDVIKTAKNSAFEPRKTRTRRKWFTPNPNSLNSRIFSEDGRVAAFTRFWGDLISSILMPIHKLFTGLRIEGRENLAGLEGGAITVCNHVHMLDSTMAKLPFFKRGFWILSLRENFEMPVIGYLIKLLGAVVLGSNHREQGDLQRALVKRINKGDIVHYFPEGMLVPYHRGLREFHNGAFALAVRAGCPVVPMVLTAKRRGGLYRLKRKPCLTLSILKPVMPETQLSAKQARKILQIQTQVEMRREMDRQLKGRKMEPLPLYGEVVYEEAEYEGAVFEKEYALSNNDTA